MRFQAARPPACRLWVPSLSQVAPLSPLYLTGALVAGPSGASCGGGSGGRGPAPLGAARSPQSLAVRGTRSPRSRRRRAVSPVCRQPPCLSVGTRGCRDAGAVAPATSHFSQLGPLALEVASPFGEGAGRPAGLSQLWRRGVLLLRPRQPTALCARARGVVGARARPARVEPGPRLRAAAAASSVPRQFSPLQTGVGSLARPLGRCLGGPHVGQGAALWEGSRPSVFESISEDSPLAEKHPGRSQLPGLPPAEAVSGGECWPLLLSLRDPHICPSCPDFLALPLNSHGASCPVSPPSLGGCGLSVPPIVG